MEISANFAFLKQEFPQAAESASFAEHHVYGDPRASCFHARHALERLVKRVYKVDETLSLPKVTNLDGYLTEPAFRALVPEVVWHKAKYIRQAGQCGGARQQDAYAGEGARRGGGAVPRSLLGGAHLSAQGG